MPDLEKTALNLAEHGFAVFPLVPGQKNPLIKDWPNQATKDPGKIHEWWTDTPNANVGIVCGEKSSHLVVIDLDNKHGHDGYKALEKWQSEHGDIPDTLQVKTPNDGIHLYYRDMGHWSSPQNVLDGVDIRCNGSYVVAPGSVIDSGQYTVLKDCPQIPSMINDSVKELLKLHSSGSESTGSGEKFVHKDLVTSNRHEYLIKFAGWLVKAHPELSPEEVEDRVRQENETVCDPPIGQGPDDKPNEFENTILKGVRKFKKRRDEGPPDEQLAETNFTPEEWKQIYAEQDHKETEELIEGLPAPIDLASVWNDPPKLAPVLIDGVLRQGHKMIISAPSKAGKSFALIELAMAIAEGMNWMGNRCKQGKVLYMNMEIDTPSFINRIQNVYKRGYGLTTDTHVKNIKAWNLRGYARPIDKLVEPIIYYCQKYKEISGEPIVAVIIDPLYKVMSGDENSNSDVAAMVSCFDRIAKETGAAVIYAHHFAKGAAVAERASIDRASGAGVFSRDPDAILTMSGVDWEDPTERRRTAWRIEYTLREFPEHDPTNIIWEYPRHYLDENLADLPLIDSNTARNKATNKKNNSEIETVYRSISKINGDGFLMSDFLKTYKEMYDKEVPRQTANDRLRKAGFEPTEEKVGNSPVWRKK